MTRIRLRESRHPADEAAYYRRVYPQGYRHDRWPDHVERVAASVEMIRRYGSLIRTAADLSCGDGAILRGVPGLARVWVGDLNGVDMEQPGWSGSTTEVTQIPPGLLPESLAHMPEDPVDLFVLSETIEHLPDPDTLLSMLTGYARYLFLSTPVEEPAGSGNLEHYWSWGQADVHQMLQEMGWNPLELRLLRPQSTLHLPDSYTYQLWMAASTCVPA